MVSKGVAFKNTIREKYLLIALKPLAIFVLALPNTELSSTTSKSKGNPWPSVLQVSNQPKKALVVNKECVTRKDAIEQLKKWHKTVSSVDFCYPQVYDKENNQYEMMSEYFW